MITRLRGIPIFKCQMHFIDQQKQVDSSPSIRHKLHCSLMIQIFVRILKNLRLFLWRIYLSSFPNFSLKNSCFSLIVFASSYSKAFHPNPSKNQFNTSFLLFVTRFMDSRQSMSTSQGMDGGGWRRSGCLNLLDH